MDSLPEPTPRNRGWEALRFASVLPAAILFAAAASIAGGLLTAMLIAAGPPPSSAIVFWVRVAVIYLPRNLAFVLAGALIAPRCRVATACGLAAIAIGVALLVHVLGQSTVGIVNYIHFVAESAGALGGVLWIVGATRRLRPRSPSKVG